MALHITIYTYKVANPHRPPWATVRTSDNGALQIVVEDVDDPEQEALAAAKAVLQHFIDQYGVKAS